LTGESVRATKSIDPKGKPLVSLVLPAYNEAQILAANLEQLRIYMVSLEAEYDWEMVIINDGSRDETGDIAERFSQGRDNVRVYHHITTSAWDRHSSSHSATAAETT
jgi:cellulose synthase/poly-beta-1,6-N-acetylglucosamine synthase-like glycosyltransferase